MKKVISRGALSLAAMAAVAAGTSAVSAPASAAAGPADVVVTASVKCDYSIVWRPGTRTLTATNRGPGTAHGVVLNEAFGRTVVPRNADGKVVPLEPGQSVKITDTITWCSGWTSISGYVTTSSQDPWPVNNFAIAFGQPKQ